MPYPYGPDTLAVVDQLKAMLQALTLADGSPAYTTVKRGAVANFTDLVPAGQIIAREDASERHASGGGIVEHTSIEIRSVVDMTDSDAAEGQIMAIRDALMPELQRHVNLINQSGVYNTVIKPGQFGWLYLPPSQWYRCHSVTLVVAQYYMVQGGVIS